MWDSYQNVVKNLRAKGLTEGITITSHYEDRNGEPYQTAWTINPLLLEGSGYSKLRVTRIRCKPWRTRREPWRRFLRT